MNSRYWGKTVIKLLNLTNSVYNFINTDSETESSGIKTSTLTREHVSTQGTFAREHISTQGPLAHKHVSTQGTLARDHVSTQAREQVFSTQGKQFSRLFFAWLNARHKMFVLYLRKVSLIKYIRHKNI